MRRISNRGSAFKGHQHVCSLLPGRIHTTRHPFELLSQSRDSGMQVWPLLSTCPLLCGAVQPGQFMRHDDKRISGPAPSAYAIQAMLLQVPVRISVGYNRPWSSRATLRRVGLGSQEASSSFWISSYRAPRDIELGLSDHRHSLPWIAFASAFASVVRAIKIVRCLASRTLRTRLARPKAGKAMRLWHLRRSLKAAVTHIATKPPRE
jgi:hypothetical protein